jgi:hypothetical protein
MLKSTTPKSTYILKAIKIIFYISAVFAIIIAILSFTTGVILAEFIESLLTQGTSEGSGFALLSSIGATAIVIIGILSLLWGILSFIIARGLGKRKNWARITGAILLIIGLIFPLISIVTGSFRGYIGLIIDGVFIYYLLFNKEVRFEFK